MCRQLGAGRAGQTVPCVDSQVKSPLTSCHSGNVSNIYLILCLASSMNLGQFSTCCESTGTGAPAWDSDGEWWAGAWYRMGTRAVSLMVPLELSPSWTELVPPLCLPTFAPPTIIACCTEGCVRIDREFRWHEHVWNTANSTNVSLYNSIPIFVLSLENPSL